MNDVSYILYIQGNPHEIGVTYNVYPPEGDGWNSPFVPTEYEIIGYTGADDLAPGTVWAAIMKNERDIIDRIKEVEQWDV